MRESERNLEMVKAESRLLISTLNGMTVSIRNLEKKSKKGKWDVGDRSMEVKIDGAGSGPTKRKKC